MTGGETTYEWTDEPFACIAERTCKRDESHAQTEKAALTSVWVLPNVGIKGQITYTATFNVSWAEPQTKVIEIPALEPDASEKFIDISKDAWYYEAVNFAFRQKLFGGTGENTFEPETPMTRGVLVTALWRMKKNRGRKE